MRSAAWWWTLLIHAWTAHAASPFMDSRREVMELASLQWNCRALESSSPSVFSCPDWPAGIQPAQGWLGALPVPGSAELEMFRSIYFPGGQMRRASAIRSLADLYFPLLEKKLGLAGLPEEYACFAIALSGLNPHYRDALDRRGIWAMDYLVARKEGLRVDSLIDERRAGDITTDAAVRHLAELHLKFGGKPAFAVLSWIYSPAYAARCFEECRGNPEDLPTGPLLDLQFVAYTTYLFRNAACPNLLQAHMDVAALSRPVFFRKDTRYDALADVLGADEQHLRAMNPAYCGELIDGSYRRVSFMLPGEIAARMESREDSLYAWQEKTPEPAAEWIRHRVRRGETLGSIARKYHTTVSHLRRWNKLRGDRIREGQQLIVGERAQVPDTKNRRTPVPDSSPAPDPATDSTATIVPDTTAAPPPAAPPNPAPAGRKYTFYTVKSGDSLWSIAKKYPGTTPEEIMKWNRCGSEIRPGQKLKIYR